MKLPQHIDAIDCIVAKRQVGTLDNGLPVYTYRYSTGGATQMGVMVEDAEKIAPQTVVTYGRIKRVDYDRF